VPASLRRFAGVGILVLLCSLAIYPFLLPGYTWTVLAGARCLLGWIPPAMSLEVLPDGAWQMTVGRWGARPGWQFVLDSHAFGQRVAFLGLAILPALVLATPVRLAIRCRLLLLALLCLLTGQVLSVAAMLYIFGTCCYAREQGRTCGLIASSLSYSSHVLTFGVWALITWRYWFADLPRSSPRDVIPPRKPRG